MSVALIAVFVLVALALVAGGLYLFSSGLTARAGACRPPLGLRLPGVEPGSEEWERAHRAEVGLWLVARGAGRASLT